MNSLKTIFTTFVISASFLFNTIQAVEPYPVGELGAKWEFPSDHLAIGMSVDELHIAFWNILNKNYLYHITENTQGLKNSAIMRDNYPVLPGQKLTVREKKVLDNIKEMINHPTHPRSMIALEETHKDMHQALKTMLPSKWKIVTPDNQPNSQDIYLYNSAVFDVVSKSAPLYDPAFPKTIFSLTLKEKHTGKKYRFIQSHIPGGPINSPGACAKFAKVVMEQFDPTLTIVLMGDMNQGPETIAAALDVAAKEKGIDQPYIYLEDPNPTHIDTEMNASWIDNYFYYSPDHESEITISEPKNLFKNLKNSVDLLNTLR